ncbi:LVIVD repeat-containing protein [Acidicapsa ligni]|uniref:hypothetical protein n=1 Tax=Acidicapsa ligni TaxID=542300 RepID=UPI0021DFFE47|nr:hypothetical protein [Acidicapsa ligni]
MLAHAEIHDDRLLSLIDHAIPEGAGGDHGSQAAISEDRQFVFFVWDNHETAYHDGLSLLDSGLAVYDFSNVKAPRLILEKRLGPHVILGALVVGQHLFISWLNPTDAPHTDWTRDVAVFDIKTPGLLSEIDRIQKITVLMGDSISPDGNVIKTDDDIYHDVTRHTDVPAPVSMQHIPPHEFEHIEDQLITDSFGPYALTVNSLMNECSIWTRSTSATPVLIQKFKPGDRSVCFGRMTPDVRSILVHKDFQLLIYSTKPIPVTERRLRRTFREASAAVASDSRSWVEQAHIQEAVSYLDGAGIDVLISGGLRGIGDKERTKILTEYSRWYMQAYGFHSPERAAMIMTKAVQSDPASAEAAALLGAFALDAVFPASTDFAKAVFWDKSRRSFANYRRLIGHDPEPLKPVTLSNPDTGTLFTSTACEDEAYRSGCGYQEAMSFDFSAVRANAKDVCDYVTENFRLRGTLGLIDLETSTGSVSVDGQTVLFSIAPQLGPQHRAYVKTISAEIDLNSLPGIANLPKENISYPPTIVPFRGKSYLLVMSSTRSPLAVYEPVQGQVCSF